MGRAKRIWYLSPMRAAKVQASLRIRAVSPEPPLLAHTSSESRGTFRQKARSLAPLNGWTCAVKVCHDGMLEDTNSLDAAQITLHLLPLKYFISYSNIKCAKLSNENWNGLITEKELPDGCKRFWFYICFRRFCKCNTLTLSLENKKSSVMVFKPSYIENSFDVFWYLDAIPQR